MSAESQTTTDSQVKKMNPAQSDSGGHEDNSAGPRLPSPEDIRSEMASGLIMDLVTERKIERRWKRIKRIVVSLFFFGGAIIYAGNYMGLLGYKFMPMTDTVAVVPITGAIGVGESASADAVNPLLQKLFKRESVKGIVLLINSGGGSPAEAERITRQIDRLREETGKPIYAACASMCASAAYMIALHTDRLYAGEYSWVGSIGAVLKSWNLRQIAERIQLGQRVYASGPLKDLLNPFKELPAVMDEKIQALVNQTAESFYDEVRREREGLLVGDGSDLFTGEVWTAPESLKHGLIDEIATLEQVVAINFEGLPSKSFTPKKRSNSFLDRFASELATQLANKVAGAGQHEVEM